MKIQKTLFFLISLSLITILILADQRAAGFLPLFEITTAAISVAVTYLHHNITDFVGLSEIYEHFKKIEKLPNLYQEYYNHLGGILINSENLGQFKSYSNAINEKLLEARNLNITNPKDIIIYENDIGTIFFFIFAFKIFGLSINSISLLFLSIIIITSLFFYLNFHKNDKYFFLLQTILFALIIAIINNYGGNREIFSLNNFRFFTVLSIIPLIHFILIFFEEKINIKSFLFTVPQIVILIFLINTRSTILWSQFFILIIFFYVFFKILKNFKRNKIKICLSSSLIIFNFLVMVFFNNLVSNNLNKNYFDGAQIKKTQVTWHSMVQSILMFPKFHEKYVCSNKKINDPASLPYLIKCGEYPKIFNDSNKPSFYKDIIFYQPNDYFSSQAVINYLDRNNISKNLGTGMESPTGLNYDLKLYNDILKKIYFDIIKNHPLDFLYIHLIIKPLRLLFELIKFSFYFLNAFNLNTIILSFIFLASLASQLFLIIKFKFKKTEQNDYFGINYLIEKIISVAIMILCSISLIFYASHQSGALDLMIFIIIFVMLYIKNLFDNKKKKQ